MSLKNESPATAPRVEPEQTGGAAGRASLKVFVEPEITEPVDVLEATTFFQTATSDAGTN